MKTNHPWLPALGLALLAALVSGCATTATSSKAALEPPKSCLRVSRSPDRTLALQVASRKLAGATRRAPVIWLISASHMGDTNYYAALQQQLEKCDLVLYEGIGGAPQRRKARLAEGEGEGMSSLQTSLARSLGLVFQLDAIDYERPHFRNSDIGVERIEQLMSGDTNPPPARLQRKSPATPTPPARETPRLAPPPKPAARDNSDDAPAPLPATGAGRGMQELMGMMDGSSFMGAMMQTGVKIISVSPLLQATVKVAFIEILGSLQGDIAQAKGLPADFRDLMQFIIKERNQVVLEDLKTALAAKPRPKSIAIFYGAGHMHDLEARICQELRYRPVEDVWLDAFSVNTREAGISQGELNMVRGMVKWQMEQLQQGE
jgi:hypothetical protein